MPAHEIDAHPEKGCKVFVTQSSKTVWVATGHFQGEHLAANGYNEISALRRWKAEAEALYRRR